jgi:hypothetical protein
MTDSAILFQSTLHTENLDVPVILMLLGVGALWASMSLDWQPFRLPVLPIPAIKGITIGRWSGLHLGLFLLGLVALAELVRINAVPGLTGALHSLLAASGYCTLLH